MAPICTEKFQLIFITDPHPQSSSRIKIKGVINFSENEIMPPTATHKLLLEPFNQSPIQEVTSSDLAEDLSSQQHLAGVNSEASNQTKSNSHNNDSNDKQDGNNGRNKVAKRNLLLDIIQSILNYLSQYRANSGHKKLSQTNLGNEVIVNHEDSYQMMEQEDEIVEFAINDRRDSIELEGDKTRVLIVAEKGSMAVTLR